LENTIVEMEKAGEKLNRAGVYFRLWSANLSSPEVRKLQMELAPKFSEMQSKISQNKKLFARIKKVYQDSIENPLDPDQQRLVKTTYESFAMNGADLAPEKQKRYAEINKELSSLYTQFANNVYMMKKLYHLLNKDQLSGLPDSFISAAAKVAETNGKEGQYAVTNTRSSMDPFLTYSDERELRKQVWTNYYSRGDNGDAYDNNALIKDILQLRRERVELLGYNNYADWRLQNRMAKNP